MVTLIFLKKLANPGLFLFIFLDTISILQIEKSIDGVLGIRTCSCMMVGADGNHGAMAAATLKIEYYPNGSQYLPNSLPTRRVHEQKLSMTKPSKNLLSLLNDCDL